MSTTVFRMIRSNKKLLEGLPDAPGVYLFYGGQSELLYVGKSIGIRTRVRSHFSSPEERWLCRQVRRIEVQETAGELGALLLESRLIKELRPMFNVAARHRRRIILARRAEDSRGYATIELEAVDYLDINDASPILAIFKHKTQAKEYLANIAKTHRLCPKLLRIENATRHCFSYHLGQCDGACMGEDDPIRYNARLDAAFEARRIKAWPYDGGLVVEEQSERGPKREIFLIDNWCLLASFTSTEEGFERHLRGNHRFDYDSYKILYSYLLDERNHARVRVVARDDFEAMMQAGPREAIEPIPAPRLLSTGSSS
ncbi:MAG TPA: hypothetical protein DCP63_11980 [Bacteroidetes bacterium]|nr:hypothetical protein [Bacteroidota bacterium]